MRHYSDFGDVAWSRGFFLASVIHWVIILIMVYYWSIYQKSETINQAKFCLILDKEPIIHEVVIAQKVPTPAPKPAPRPVPPPPRQEPPPEAIELPPEETQDIMADAQKEARAYLEKLNLKLRAQKEYPPEALKRGIEGTVMVGFTIQADGKLTDIKVVESSGSSILDDAALSVISQVNPFDPVPEVIIQARGKSTWEFTAPIRYYLNE